MMKILVVPTTDWLGHPFPSRLHHIFERLSERNEIHVLRFPFYPQEMLKTNTVVHECGGIKTEKLAFFYLANAPFHYETIRGIIKKTKVDYVVVSNLLSGYVAAKATQDKSIGIFDLSDYFPASGAGYYFPLESIKGRTVSFLLEKILRNTMHLLKNVVTCSHALRDYVNSVGIEKSFILTNGVDEHFLSSKRDGEDIRERYGLTDCITIGYIGSIEFWVNMLPLLQAVKSLAKKHKIKLFLVGAGLRTKSSWEVWKKIRELKISENVVWLKRFVPYAEVPDHIAAMDICTIPFDHNHPVAYYSAPNKLWEYLALGKPVITTPIPEPLIQAGQFIELAQEKEDYEKTIVDYIRDPDKYKTKVAQAERIVRDNTWTRVAQGYERLLESLN